MIGRKWNTPLSSSTYLYTKHTHTHKHTHAVILMIGHKFHTTGAFGSCMCISFTRTLPFIFIPPKESRRVHLMATTASWTRVAAQSVEETGEGHSGRVCRMVWQFMGCSLHLPLLRRWAILQVRPIFLLLSRLSGPVLQTFGVTRPAVCPAFTYGSLSQLIPTAVCSALPYGSLSQLIPTAVCPALPYGSLS